MVDEIRLLDAALRREASLQEQRLHRGGEARVGACGESVGSRPKNSSPASTPLVHISIEMGISP